MSFGSAQAAQVKRLLSRFGSTTSATIRRESGGVLDPVAGEYTGGTSSTLPLFSAQTKVTKSMLVDERIRITDVRLICSNDIVPLEADTVVIDGRDYQVIVINKHKPAETVVAYEVFCRV